MHRLGPGATEPPEEKVQGVSSVINWSVQFASVGKNPATCESFGALIIKRAINLNRIALIIIYYCFLYVLYSEDLWIHSQETAPNC